MRVRVVVHGRVQGVWFRDSCRRRANELRVQGWVRNRSDGTVEVVVFSSLYQKVMPLLDSGRLLLVKARPR